MDRKSYEADICARLKDARPVPCKPVSLPDWHPVLGDCHANVDAWIKTCPGSAAVRGWVAWYQVFPGMKLTAHSVVRGPNGELYDITIPPPRPGESRAWQKFVPHEGDEQLFRDMKKDAGKSFDCPDCESV